MWILEDFWGWLISVLVAILIVFGVAKIAHAGQFVGETPAYAREVGFEQRFYYKSGGNGDGQIEYICKAYPGNGSNDDTSAAVWQVAKFTYDSSNRISTIAYAGDDDNYNQICDNRASLNYS